MCLRAVLFRNPLLAPLHIGQHQLQRLGPPGILIHHHLDAVVAHLPKKQYQLKCDSKEVPPELLCPQWKPADVTVYRLQTIIGAHCSCHFARSLICTHVSLTSPHL